VKTALVWNFGGLDELNRIIKNSKIIPENQKQAYEKKTSQDSKVDFLKNMFNMKDVTPK
jgi:hypothetical protein